MPLHFGRPHTDWIREQLAKPGVAFGYAEVGATAPLDAPLPAHLAPRYDLDHHRVVVGEGRAAFERAWDCVRAWGQFDVSWARLHGADEPAHVGQVVGTLVSFAGVWSLNPCRVVYVQEPGPTGTIAAVGYGTLAGHVESGEERFRVSIDPQTGRVEYEIAAFSRPAQRMVRLGYPLARGVQRRFARESARAVQRAVAAGAARPR